LGERRDVVRSPAEEGFKGGRKGDTKKKIERRKPFLAKGGRRSDHLLRCNADHSRSKGEGEGRFGPRVQEEKEFLDVGEEGVSVKQADPQKTWEEVEEV